MQESSNSHLLTRTSFSFLFLSILPDKKKKKFNIYKVWKDKPAEEPSKLADVPKWFIDMCVDFRRGTDVSIDTLYPSWSSKEDRSIMITKYYRR